jgi:hypothetical protein
MFNSLFKATTVLVDLPTALVADLLTCGGLTTDQDESYTSKAAGRFVNNVSNAANPDKD